ncbi:MAG: NAD-dependent deacylase [Phycisphaerales bacterium]|nr:NAD-dependent deacylase [Phycisphaerales bacterium]
MADNLAQQIERLAGRIAAARAIAVMTGAGVSAESGVATFRDAGGLWEGHRPEDVATPQAFARDPEMVWRFYLARRRGLCNVKPNAAHHALVAIEQRCPQFCLITQNVDGLHHVAGSRNIIALHGDIWIDRCTKCGHERRAEAATQSEPRPSGSGQNKSEPRQSGSGKQPIPQSTSTTSQEDTNATTHAEEMPSCKVCGALARPGVVWFGEMLPPGAIEHAAEAASTCELMLVIGTSSVVQPAASLAHIAKRAGATVIEINLEPTPLTASADETLQGKAAEIMSQVIRRIPTNKR